MYLWKCWRETRTTFLILLGAMLAASAFGLYVSFDPFGWIAAKADWPRTLWHSTAQALMLTMVGVTPVVGFLLGSMGVGGEFERRTADFLLTRPRSRRYFLWTSWAVGAAQLIVLVIVAMTLVWIPSYLGAPARNAATLAGMCIVALAVYSVTYLMTTLARNSRNGAGLGVLVFTAYTGIGVWLKLWYEISIPNVWDLVFSSGRAAREIDAFGASPLTALGPMLGWLAVCLALTFGAQYVFERHEV